MDAVDRTSSITTRSWHRVIVLVLFIADHHHALILRPADNQQRQNRPSATLTLRTSVSSGLRPKGNVELESTAATASQDADKVDKLPNDGFLDIDSIGSGPRTPLPFRQLAATASTTSRPPATAESRLILNRTRESTAGSHGRTVDGIPLQSKVYDNDRFYCEASIREVQGSVLKLFESQLEYGRGLHAVHHMVETLRRDVAVIGRSKSVSPSSLVQQPPATQSSAFVDDDPKWNSKKEAEVTSSPPSAAASYKRSLSVWKKKHQRLSARLTVVEQNSKKLEAAVDYLRTEVDRLTATIRDISAANKECNAAVEQLGAKQAEINANLARKTHSLEKSLEMIRLSSKNQISSSSSSLTAAVRPPIRQLPYTSHNLHRHNSQHFMHDDSRSNTPTFSFHGDQHTDTGTPITCPQSYVQQASSCYKFVNLTLTWIEAEKYCQIDHHSSHLVAIETKAEMEHIVSYRSHNNARWSSRYVWIGANDMEAEGIWTWVGTKQLVVNRASFTDWRPGQPDNRDGDQHCVYVRMDPVATPDYARSMTSFKMLSGELESIAMQNTPVGGNADLLREKGSATAADGHHHHRHQHQQQQQQQHSTSNSLHSLVNQIRAAASEDDRPSGKHVGHRSGMWDDGHCHKARFNFVCEIILQP